ncbi:aldo/keto reductase [Jeotgalibacillus soli]|uniref:aldo/keto reductase n=1 Tax=Jeotgalibacillus soli TaxID=889306 RepID=UPI00059756CE
MSNLQGRIPLHNGVEMPQIGLGVYKMSNSQETINAITAALANGYRAIDTASFYQNEVETGIAVKESGISREELFITTKVWNTDQGYDTTLKSFDGSLQKLGMDYVDLYLIHWPVKEKYKETWKAMERLYAEGLVKAIGVSNFHIPHLKDLLNDANEKPVINQIELHPRLTQEHIRSFCDENGITVESWSPLARGSLLSEPTINHIAKKHNKSAAQVILRWHLQHDLVIIPKSVSEKRIIENADLFDFSLSLEDMRLIDQLNMNERVGTNPDTFES